MKKFISINLNQSESRETIREQWKERSRWVVFGLITFFLVFVNGETWWIGRGYSKLIERKEVEIKEVKIQISALRKEGKNLSKEDIMSLADLENNRILWARNMQLIGEMTPEDMAITSMKYKKDKIIIGGVAVVYEDRKDFDIVHEYISKLKRNKLLGENFSKIKFNQGSLKKIREQSVVEFEIEAALRVSVKIKGNIS
ncbi:MAG: PilN domain-containing protein [Candidatus Marinimicrobia bacterium]|nr:PilN domain-containing protein [Candidatus Neomarinimicrobiota bacterium]